MTLLTSGASPASTNAAYVATERLYLDKDGNVVNEDDPGRVELLVGVNGVLPRDTAAQYGLIEDVPAQESASVVSEPVAVKTSSTKPPATPEPPGPPRA